MNKLIIALLLFVVLIFGNSCLKEKLLDTPTPDEFITGRNEIEAIFTNCYIWSSVLYRREQGELIEMIADNVYGTLANTMIEGSTKTRLLLTNQIVGFLYRNSYFAIRDVNGALRDIENTNVDADYKKRAIAEAKFIRGWNYYNLVRWFGGVPIRTTQFDLSQPANLARASVREVYEQVFKDLKEAGDSLPTRNLRPATERDRANKGSAYAMLASAYLTYGQLFNDNDALTKANGYADSVINSARYNLLSNYADLFDVTKEANSYNEIIFRVPIIGDANNLGGSKPSFYNPITLAATAFGSGAGQGLARVQPFFVEPYFANEYVNDYRVETNFHTNWINRNNNQNVYTFPRQNPIAITQFSNESTPYIAKYKDITGFSRDNHNNDVPLIRYSEMFFIKAEALNELNGPTTAAVNAFNMVRARARLANGVARTAPADLALVGLTKQTFRLKILEERSLEFFAEFQRWYDLKRMKHTDGRTLYEYQFDVYLPSLPQGLPTYNRTTRVWSAGRTEPNYLMMSATGTRLPGVNAATYLYLPIPQAEMLTNNLMTQNPGY